MKVTTQPSPEEMLACQARANKAEEQKAKVIKSVASSRKKHIQEQMDAGFFAADPTPLVMDGVTSQLPALVKNWKRSKETIPAELKSAVSLSVAADYADKKLLGNLKASLGA